MENINCLCEVDERYVEDSLSCAASYLMSCYNSDCVKGINNSPLVCWEYDTNKGYMGLFGRYQDFIYTDTEKINGSEFPVGYLDCSVFLSLITKCIKYEDSPYYYAFNTVGDIDKKVLYHKSLENGNYNKPYTFDWLNNINTEKMAYISDKSGNPPVLLSSFTIENTAPVYTKKNIYELKTGDIVFRGDSISADNNPNSSYLGIDHCGYFVKSLAEINNAEGVPSGVTFNEITNTQSSIGYIVEVRGSRSNLKYDNCMRITAFEKWAWYKSSDEKWKYTNVYKVSPISNIMTSNKACVQNTGVLHCYDFDVECLQEKDKNGYYQVASIIPRIAGGLIIKENDDLNDYTYNGSFRCNTKTVLNTLENTPTKAYSYNLQCVGFNVNGLYGTQIVYCDRSVKSLVYTRSRNDGKWSPWVQISTIAE